VNGGERGGDYPQAGVGEIGVEEARATERMILV